MFLHVCLVGIHIFNIFLAYVYIDRYWTLVHMFRMTFLYFFVSTCIFNKKFIIHVVCLFGWALNIIILIAVFNLIFVSDRCFPIHFRYSFVQVLISSIHCQTIQEIPVYVTHSNIYLSKLCLLLIFTYMLSIRVAQWCVILVDLLIVGKNEWDIQLFNNSVVAVCEIDFSRS